MTKLIDLPSEVLFEICFNVFLTSVSGTWLEYKFDPRFGEYNSLANNCFDLVQGYNISKILTNTFVCNIDALHSCKEATPDRVYEWITRVRCARWDIFPLLSTCKRLHEIAESILWNFVETNQESKKAIGDLLRILSNVMKRPELGRHVRALGFRHFISDDDESPFSSRERRKMKEILEWDSAHQVATLLDRLPNLRAMKLVAEAQPDYFSVFSPSTLYPSGFPLGLQNLTEFSFHWEDPDGEGFGAEMLLPLFLLPSLKTLYLGHIAAAADKDDLRDFTRYYGMSTITTLIIDLAIVEEAAITAFCKLPKQLEKFEYAYGGGSNRVSNAEPEEYLSALRWQKPSLTTIKIRGDRDMQTCSSDDAPNPGIIHSFQSLTEYAFPLSLMLSLDPDRTSTQYKLEDVLPVNIQNLTMFAYDDWSFDGVHDLLKDFFSFGRSRFPGLRQMKLKIQLWGDDYLLHEPRREPRKTPREEASEAEAVIRSRVESLKQRAKDKGVTLEVDLDTLRSAQWLG